MRDYDIISTDPHLEVPPCMWEPFVDEEFQQFWPKVVELRSGGDAWFMLGRYAPVPLGLNFSAGRGWEKLKPSGLSYSENLVGAGDREQRLTDMDRDGVDAELLFVPVSVQRTLDTGGLPREACVALCRGYSDWLSQEHTDGAPTAFAGWPFCRPPRSTTRSTSFGASRLCLGSAVLFCTRGPTARRFPFLRRTTGSGLRRSSSISPLRVRSASEGAPRPRWRPLRSRVS